LNRQRGLPPNKEFDTAMMKLGYAGLAFVGTGLVILGTSFAFPGFFAAAGAFIV